VLPGIFGAWFRLASSLVALAAHPVGVHVDRKAQWEPNFVRGLYADALTPGALLVMDRGQRSHTPQWSSRNPRAINAEIGRQ
jgi:hypothetical protein